MSEAKGESELPLVKPDGDDTTSHMMHMHMLAHAHASHFAVPIWRAARVPRTWLSLGHRTLMKADGSGDRLK